MPFELLILRFPTPSGAKLLLGDLLPLHDEHLIRVEEAAIAAKDAKGRVKLHFGTDLAAQGMLSGSLWGTLAGALFLEPFLGLVVGGLCGLLTGGLLKQANSGISRRVVKRTAQRTLEPDCSALYLLVSKLTPAKVAARLHQHDATIVSTSLSVQNERELRQAWRAVREHGPLAVQDRDSSRTRLLPEAI
jgi:uncharacterized membrane protein